MKVYDVEEVVLANYRPNSWNPNRMLPHLFESLKHDLSKRGWLQNIIVWGKDEKGAVQNLIIDGEHRWRAATELGMKTGTAIVLDGITEAHAKAITITMDQKRGAFDRDALGELLRSIQFELGAENLGLELGFSNEDVMQMLASPAVNLPGEQPENAGPAKIEGNETGMVPSDKAEHVRMVQLFFSKAEHEEFVALAQRLGAQLKTDATSQLVLEAMRRAGAAS